MGLETWTSVLKSKVRPPAAVVLGSPGEAAFLVDALELQEATCYQMDLYQAGRLGEELRLVNRAATVATAADLWDLPPDFQTIIYPTPPGGERSLKIDMVEQAFHILRPHGQLLVLSPYASDELFPGLLKKIYGRVHASHAGTGTLFWSQRDGNRPRRRHEMTFHARIGEGPSLAFVSRPGVFSYGRMDEGARALLEVADIVPGDRILDVGCGCGTNGIFAARQSGPSGSVAFVDSNVRALALAELNARRNGRPHFQTYASPAVEGPPERSFDVVLANPPYYAQGAIAELFIGRGRELLRPGGRFYLVTRQPKQVIPLVEARFEEVEGYERRGYIVLGARAAGSDAPQRT